ncbi:MAG: 1-acyl-sn-glycerol-3-phosphate acyltransferase [Planctomycetes bacterium]|nr:1-acyl-sn-glycerol-3-phosphate acyltransferase [Planctomycetota bacterium]
MRHLRAPIRLLLFVTLSVGTWVLHVVTVPTTRRLSPARGAALHDAIARTWARTVARILGLRTHTRGTPPRTPFVLVSNHLGYVDIVTLMTLVPATFVSRADVSGWPLMGRLARIGNTIFVDRDSRRDVVRANECIAGILAEGRGVVFFPEGTSSGGDSVLPFRSSLLDPAVKIGHPVHYASLSYTTPDGSPPASESVCWWGDMTFFKHFYGLLGLPGIEARVVFGPVAVSAASRHELAERLHHAVSAQLDGRRAPETAPCA